MPEWYHAIKVARYAGMPGPEFVRLPVFWQRAYETAMVAELEAGHAQIEQEMTP